MNGANWFPVSHAVSERGVVFFRAQNNLTNELQKKLVHRLGQLSGKPASSTLHIHPILNSTAEFGVEGDNEISTISSLQRKKLFRHDRQTDPRRYDSAQWHSDIQFEPAPADYTSLRLTQLPRTGGDTVWASGYDLYDRFSSPYQRFFEGLTATFVGQGFIDAAARNPERIHLHEVTRGSPANVGRDLEAVHPVVRTNPVTGWKSIFAVGPFPKFINELSARESDELLAKFKQTVAENHDLQVRFKWRNQNDLGDCPIFLFPFNPPPSKFGARGVCANLDIPSQRYGTIVAFSTPPPSTTRAWGRGSETALSELVSGRILTPTVSQRRRR